MAEILLSSFLSVFFDKLASSAMEQLARSMGIHSELQNMKSSLSQIEALLYDASKKEITHESVKRWLNSLQHLAYDIEDILDELATEVMHRELTDESEASTSKVRKLIPSAFTHFQESTRIKKKLKDITTKLQDLAEEKNNLGLSWMNERPKSTNRRLQTSLVDSSSIIGREGEKQELLRKLLGPEQSGQNFSIVPIVGMGGIGKTTLARLLYDEVQVKKHFQFKAWVCVSDEFDIFNISKVIFQSVTGENKYFEDLNLLQVALRDQIREKRFLLVLDDVWSESFEDWEILVGPFLEGASGSKIIMTTRKQQLLKKLGYNHPYHLQNLSDDDAMSLFAQNALGVNNFDSHPVLRPHGEGIVKKCDGLPLALKALGRLLRTKTDEEEWKEVLNSDIWRLQEGDGVLPALKLSYHDLPAHLKRLFAYTSLFPKDHVFDKEDLILLWMAEGLLHQSTSNKLTERLGHEYFEELLSRSFFQRVPNEETMFMMHDLMNDLATFVAGYFVVGSDRKPDKEALEKCRHMSFIRELYVPYQKFEAFKKAKSLRTFLAVSVGVEKGWTLRHFHLSNKILLDLIHDLPLLRVLCLSHFMIGEVPESIGNLKHLRYLNLSKTEITQLPESVCNLYNLQSLIVSGCKRLAKLPNSFQKLKNLRHFDIWDTPLLEKMPLGIGELKSLQTLSKIIVGGENGLPITELKNLKNLHGKTSIVSYGNTELSHWVRESSFLQLTHISISSCKRCTALSPLGQLTSLKELFIQGMDAVKVVGLELLGTSGAFHSLEILSFKYMPGWEEWSANSGVADAVFPCLQQIHISECPKLVQVSLEAMPSVRVLKIKRCGVRVLTSLVHAASSIIMLNINNVAGLTDVAWRGVMEYLGLVEEVKINNCNEIKYLWESEAEASKVLVNLRRLGVIDCENLLRLGNKEEEDEDYGSNLLTSLRMLFLKNCKSMERCRCPNGVDDLRIIGCSSITSFSLPTAGQKVRLFIDKCPKLLEKEFGGEKMKTSMLMLEYVGIYNWDNLRSIIELSSFIHLTSLSIHNCPSMESFPDQELPNLTSLSELEIKNCPSIDASFPRGFWPPKLKYLTIGQLKKPISEWGPQNFPISLAVLDLWSGPSEDVKSFSQLSHLLPSSLNSLYINGFEEMESLLTGLQHIASLQHLRINKCPKIRHLPEMLLFSLLSLRIDECPKLKERCSRNSSYWPFISHIPCIYIDRESQT